MMPQDLQYFDYNLPSEPAQRYADNAIECLREIKDKFPQFYGNFISPSEVLTLSGVRAFDTYYDLGEDAKVEQIEALQLLLKAHGILLIEETFKVANELNTSHYYSLVHTKALLDIPNRYRHLPSPGWNEPNLAAMEKDTDFYIWWYIWQFAITAHIEDDPILKAWHKSDMAAFHHITFGILLGYPGEAISSVLYETQEDHEQGRVLKANIGFAAAFDGAQPVYQYLENAAENSNIRAHQQLWSDILTGVYEVMEPDLLSVRSTPVID